MVVPGFDDEKVYVTYPHVGVDDQHSRNVCSHGDVWVKMGFSGAWIYLLSVIRYPIPEPNSMTWLFPHQIKLTFGRRTGRPHQDPACGGRGLSGTKPFFRAAV